LIGLGKSVKVIKMENPDFPGFSAGTGNQLKEKKKTDERPAVKSLKHVCSLNGLKAQTSHTK
jgi:hypothetical protein